MDLLQLSQTILQSIEMLEFTEVLLKRPFVLEGVRYEISSEYLQTNDVGEPEEKAKPFAALAHWRKPSPQGD
jgi:hypothetical protein